MNIKRHSFYNTYFKRLIDFALVLIALLLLSPFFILISIIVRIKLGSPIFFKQKRPGKDEKIFEMYKFRTMTEEKSSDGSLLLDEYRLTSFGKFLRSTSLDELPSLLNILKGDMSIVGPRPLLIRYLPFYTNKERERHNVRPGLTGLAQVNGRNLLEWDKRLDMDVQYVRNLGVTKDIYIIYLTFMKVIQRKDIVSGNEHILKSLDVERKDRFHENS